VIGALIIHPLDNAYPISFLVNRHKATLEMWQEAHVSALLRSVLYSDDPSYHLTAYRRLNPVSSSDDELRFLQAAEALFLKGRVSSFSIVMYPPTTKDFYRLASWLRRRDSSRNSGLESPNRRYPKILW
jgi:hypothetical protein